MTFATGEMKPKTCERCRARLFDGLMFGVIRCRRCNWMNWFTDKWETDKLYKSKEHEYIVKTA